MRAYTTMRAGLTESVTEESAEESPIMRDQPEEP